VRTEFVQQRTVAGCPVILDFRDCIFDALPPINSMSLTIPSGRIYVKGEFSLRAGQGTAIVIDFDAGQSVHCAGNPNDCTNWKMKPVINMVGESVTDEEGNEDVKQDDLGVIEQNQDNDNDEDEEEDQEVDGDDDAANVSEEDDGEREDEGQEEKAGDSEDEEAASTDEEPEDSGQD